MVNEKRLLDEFIKLIKIDSETGNEDKIANYVRPQLEELDAKIVFDNAHKAVGGKCGNMIATIPGKLDAPVIMLNAHMDTVKPGVGIKPVIEGDIIKSDGNTILGADDKSGIAAIIEALRSLKEQKIPHRPVEVVLTIAEEIGVVGSKNLDFSLVKSKMGFALDDHKVGEFTVSAPAKSTLTIKVHGLESHAGVAPEKGINSIVVAARAVGRMKLGRISEDTVANIGTFKAEGAVNVVNPLVEIKAEARSSVTDNLNAQVKHMIDVLESTAKEFSVEVDGKKTVARCEVKEDRAYNAFYIKDSEPVCKLAKAASEKMGYKCKFNVGLGGSDANHFNDHGIKVIMMGTGMDNPHSKTEFIHFSEMKKSAELLMQILTMK